jgi:hypothetical protein
MKASIYAELAYIDLIISDAHNYSHDQCGRILLEVTERVGGARHNLRRSSHD